MLFNSLNYAFFLPIVFLIYWYILKNNLKYQNIFLLTASYFFYSCWDWRFLFLLIFSTLIDYYTGLKMFTANNVANKKKWFILSVFTNLGILGTLKYFNFFSETFTKLTSSLGFNISPFTLNFILPVGISFYTFHGLSYVIDIYHNKIKAEKNFIDYAVFVSFFPLLVAGPIERATHLLPQIQKKRIFNYSKATDGLKQILWGLFKKVVIADQCAEYVNIIFSNVEDHSGSTLLLGAIYFSFQIYGDFSGYSDIALGTAKLFGIELLRNFNFPYFSRDIAEFWRRWHISLSSWFRDYIYIPIGGSTGGIWIKVRNTFIIFLISGFWHGANWTFIVWGALNALFFLPLLLTKNNRKNIEIVAKGKKIPSFKDGFAILSTFLMTTLAWIFFRANSLEHAIKIISEIFSKSFFSIPYFIGIGLSIPVTFIILIFIYIEWIGREQEFAISNLGKHWKSPFRYLMYYAIVISIFWFGGKAQQFIYFQF
jgi:alginate O-acetyltransferase complex protein AlgI